MILKILNKSALLLVGSALGRLTMFLINFILIHSTSQESFGQFSIVRNTIAVQENIINSGLGPASIKSVAQEKQKGNATLAIKSILSTNIVLALTISMMMVLLSDKIIGSFLLGQKGLTHALEVGVLILFFGIISSALQNILIGLEEFKFISILSTITTIISLPFIYFLINSYGTLGALFSVVLYYSIDSIIKLFLIFHLSQKQKNKFIGILQFSKKLFTLSTPVLLGVIINGAAFWYSKIIIINIDKGFKSIAVFDAAFQWLTIIMIISGSAISVTLPMLSKASSDREKTNIHNTNMLVNITISIIISSFFIYFSSEIMSLYGDKYIEGNIVLIILSLTSILFTIALVYNRYMISKEKNWIVFFAAVIGSTTMHLVLWFSSKFGSEGLALSFLSYYLSSSIFYVIYVSFYMKKVKV